MARSAWVGPTWWAHAAQGPSMEEQLAPFPAVRAWMDRVPHQVGRRQYTQVPMCFDPLLPMGRSS